MKTETGRIEKWIQPDWMKSIKWSKLIPCTKDQVEELVNAGSEINVFNNAPKAMMCVSVKTSVKYVEKLHNLYEAMQNCQDTKRIPDMKNIDLIIF